MKPATTTTTRRLAAASLALLLAGCSVPREAGFPDVQQTVEARLGQRVHWNQGTPEDAAVADEVRALLAQPLTADAAVQIALLSNRNLQATYEDLSIAQADLVQAGLLSNPVFHAEFKFAEGTGDLAFEGGIVQDFIDLLQMPLRKRIAAGAFEAAKLRVAGEVIDLATRTRTAFYALQAEGQMLELRRTVLDAAEASYATSRALYDAGNIPEVDVAQERSQYERAKLEVATAEAAVLADREALSALMGLWGTGNDWQIADRLPDPPAEELPIDDAERRAVEASLDLAMFEQAAVNAGRELGLTRPFALLNEAELGVVGEKHEGGDWEAGPSIGLPIPLFDQGQARTASARARLRQAQQRYAALAVDLRAAARTAAIRLRAARERALYHRDVILPVAGQVMDQTQLHYNAMQIGVFQLLQARQGQVQAAADYVDALRTYWLARAELQHVLAGRLGSASSVSPASTAPTMQAATDAAGGH